MKDKRYCFGSCASDVSLVRMGGVTPEMQAKFERLLQAIRTDLNIDLDSQETRETMKAANRAKEFQFSYAQAKELLLTSADLPAGIKMPADER